MLDLVIPCVRAIRARALVLILAGATAWLALHACAVARENARLESSLERLRRDLEDSGLIIDAVTEQIRRLREAMEAHDESSGEGRSPEDRQGR